jgi:hypothetical protein
MELSQQKKMLEKINIALKVMLEHREQDRMRLEENVLANVRQLVSPYVEKLRLQKLDDRSRNFVEIIESRLTELAGIIPALSKKRPFLLNLADAPDQFILGNETLGN